MKYLFLLFTFTTLSAQVGVDPTNDAIAAVKKVAASVAADETPSITEAYCKEVTDHFERIDNLEEKYEIANQCKELYVKALTEHIDKINEGTAIDCNFSELLVNSRKFHKVTIDLLKSQHPDKEYIDYLEDLYKGLLYDSTSCELEEQKVQFVDANVNKYILENTFYEFENAKGEST